MKLAEKILKKLTKQLPKEFLKNLSNEFPKQITWIFENITESISKFVAEKTFQMHYWRHFPRNSTRNFQKICRLIFQRCLFETHCGPRRFFFFFNSKSTIFPSTFVIFCTHLNVVFVYVNCSIREIASHLFVFFKIWEFWKKKSEM